MSPRPADHDDLPCVIHLVNSLEGGGTERNLVELLGALDPRDARHAIVTLRRAGALAERLPNHVACEALMLSGRSRLGGLRLARAALTRGARVLHARNTGCWWDAVVAKLCAPGLRLVLGYHGLDYGGPFRPRDRWAARLACLMGAEFATVSRHGAKRLVDECGVPVRRIHVIRNGVRAERRTSAPVDDRRATRASVERSQHFADEKRSARVTVRQSLGVGADDVVFLSVGSLSPVKRFDRLLRALTAMGKPEVSHSVGVTPWLWIAGDGPCRGELAVLAGALGVADRVRWLGARDDVPSLLAAADVYVCSSDSEELSNALLEAMAAGLPVVTTDVGDHAEVVGGDARAAAGLVVPIGDDGALACAMGELVMNADLRRRLGEAAARRGGDFTFDAMVRGYAALYRRLIGNTGRKASSIDDASHSGRAAWRTVWLPA